MSTQAAHITAGTHKDAPMYEPVVTALSKEQTLGNKGLVKKNHDTSTHGTLSCFQENEDRSSIYRFRTPFTTHRLVKVTQHATTNVLAPESTQGDRDGEVRGSRKKLEGEGTMEGNGQCIFAFSCDF